MSTEIYICINATFRFLCFPFSTPLVDGATSCLTDELLLEISASFSNRDNCIVLAVRLDIAEAGLTKLLQESTFYNRMAFDVMKAWMRAYPQQARGPTLYAVLRDIERDVAERFKERLSKSGKAISLSGALLFYCRFLSLAEIESDRLKVEMN